MSDSKITSLDMAPEDSVALAKSKPKKVAASSSGHDAALSGRMVEVNISASEKEHGGDAAEVGLNGVFYKIPRGEYHELPEEVVEVLRNAVTDVTLAAPGGAGVITRAVPRFNFQTR